MNLTVSSLKAVNYTTQYLLTVNSQFGPTTGSGWHDANSTVKVTVPTHVNASGLSAMMDGEYVLAQLVTDDGRAVSGSLVMDRPGTVTAVYVLTYPIRTYVELGALMIVIALSIVGIERRLREPAANTTSS